jgi:hypothetical protein
MKILTLYNLDEALDCCIAQAQRKRTQKLVPSNLQLEPSLNPLNKGPPRYLHVQKKLESSCGNTPNTLPTIFFWEQEDIIYRGRRNRKSRSRAGYAVIL